MIFTSIYSMPSVAFFPFLVLNAGLGCIWYGSARILSILAFSCPAQNVFAWEVMSGWVRIIVFRVALLLQHITLWLVSPGLDRSKFFAFELFPQLCVLLWIHISVLVKVIAFDLWLVLLCSLSSNGLNHKLLKRNSQLGLGWHFRNFFVLFQVALQNQCICIQSIHNLLYFYWPCDQKHHILMQSHFEFKWKFRFLKRYEL